MKGILNRFWGIKPEPVLLSDYIIQIANSSKRSRSYKRRYWSLAEKLQQFESFRKIRIYSDTLSYQVFEDFIYFMLSSFPYRSSTIEGYQSRLISALNRAGRDGYKVDLSLREYEIKSEEAVSVYLNEAEIVALNSLKLSGNDSIIRDIFLIGCCTGLRYSDYSRTKDLLLKDNTISLLTRKTGTRVVLPIHWILQDVLLRNGGTFPVMKTSQQNFNKVLKTLCKKAKINEEILVERIEGGKPIRRKVKKFRLVSSHTARRSFATNCYLAGIETVRIMMCTGHATESAFFKYIRISKQENAKELSVHPFFVRK